MTKEQRYIIEFDSSQWCGGDSYVLVDALDADDAVFLADMHMQDAMQELFSEEMVESEDEFDNTECVYTVQSVMLLEDSPHKEFVINNDGSDHYYPLI